jgi:CBS domain-containing protein
MLVGEVCTRQVVVASRETSIYEASRLMRKHHAGDVIVTDDSNGKRMPVGIVTDRDIVVEVLAQGLNPAGLTVGEIMSATLVTAKERDTVFETVRLMRAEAVRRAPIVDAVHEETFRLAVDPVFLFLAGVVRDVVGFSTSIQV